MEGAGCPVAEVAVPYLAFWMQIQRAFSVPPGTPVGTCGVNTLPN